MDLEVEVEQRKIGRQSGDESSLPLLSQYHLFCVQRIHIVSICLCVPGFDGIILLTHSN